MSRISHRLLPALATLAIAAPAQAHDTGLPHVLHAYGPWVAIGAVVTTALFVAGAVFVHIKREGRCE